MYAKYWARPLSVGLITFNKSPDWYPLILSYMAELWSTQWCYDHTSELPQLRVRTVTIINCPVLLCFGYESFQIEQIPRLRCQDNLRLTTLLNDFKLIAHVFAIQLRRPSYYNSVCVGFIVGPLDYGNNKNNNYFGQYWHHDYFLVTQWLREHHAFIELFKGHASACPLKSSLTDDVLLKLYMHYPMKSEIVIEHY